MDKRARFEKIKRYFKEQDEEGMRNGRLPMRSTSVGFWGTSNLDDVYEFFNKKSFAENTKFCDLGCGDGRVVLVAALFMDATGIEYDEELAERARQAAKTLGIDCTILCDDILSCDLSSFDVLYMYADRNFSYLTPKLKNELQGTLYLYHDTYHPEGLRKEQTTWVGQIPIFAYTNPKQ